MKRIHLDTDLGSDTDDLAALAMLLGWPNVQLTGITTVSDPDGRRAGMTAYALAIAGRDDVPLAAGVAGSLAGYTIPLAFFDHHWPEPIEPRPSLPGAATEALVAAAERGDTIVAIGPYTNLAIVEAVRPGLLASTEVVLMGGHVPPMPDGFPSWDATLDTNVQQDAFASAIVLERCAPTVVPLFACARVTLRASHLDPLRAGGPLARLVADQGEALARDQGMSELGRAFPRLPDDLLNFQYDPLACAVAAAWGGVTVEDLPVAARLTDGLLRLSIESGAPRRLIVTDVDADAFDEAWLDAVLRAAAR
ncbi:MAG TPA: nucleoside hydrolase [Actinomycetota bacterium]|nr:nucleoside hydrolase [Actinomycetota bacterium]